MRRGWTVCWSGLASVVALAACSNIIGIDGYAIDPALDGDGGGASAGPKGTGGELPLAQGGDGSSGAGGIPAGGAGGPDAGGSAVGGEAGAAGAPPTSGCQSAQDCDDTIDCTTDTCGADGQCVHSADDTVCTPATGMCSHCKLGIGCVDAAPQEQELLLDPSFDQNVGDWVEYSDTFSFNISADASAHSASNLVKFGPARAKADEREFAGVYQEVYIPPGTIKLTVSGWYKMLPGSLTGERPAAGDYVTLTLFGLDADVTRYVDYHEWAGSQAKQTTWTRFTYDTSKSKLAKVLGLDVSLDLVCETWDTLYYFDSLSLTASVCE